MGNIPVKRKIKFLKNEKLQCNPHLGHTNPRSFLKSFFHSTNLSLRRTLYLIVTFIRYAQEGYPSSLIQIKEFSERPRIVPHEVICLNVVSRALSSNLNALLFDV